MGGQHTWHVLLLLLLLLLFYFFYFFTLGKYNPEGIKKLSIIIIMKSCVFAAVTQEVQELDKAHQEQQANLMADMKKDMAAMQRKILVDCVSHTQTHTRTHTQRTDTPVQISGCY